MRAQVTIEKRNKKEKVTKTIKQTQAESMTKQKTDRCSI